MNLAMFPEPAAGARFRSPLFQAFVRYDVLFGRVDYLSGLIAVATWQGPHAASEAPGQLAQASFDDLPDGVPLNEKASTPFSMWSRPPSAG